ncbi:hypothetical protein J1614_008180 [Plenodomus biglobosus]|nr:hypothetical protein J1614_008180 [Plenodomus biglobosus]
MADQGTHTLASLPLEVRHNIFNNVATRHIESTKLLRQWFEKQDAKQQMAELAANAPAAPAPRVIYSADYYDRDSELSDSDEDEEDDGNDRHVRAAPLTHTSISGQNQPLSLPLTQQLPAPTVPTISHVSTEAEAEEQEGTDNGHKDNQQDGIHGYEDGQEEGEGAGENIEGDGTIQNAQNNDAEEDNANQHGEESEGTDDTSSDDRNEDTESDDGDDLGGNAAAITKRPVVVVHAKWRHIPKFMYLTRCPPPVQLHLLSKQLNAEAKDWFYDVTVLRIEATASFSHTTFYEEAFNQIASAGFSPIENIRKVEVTFVWDSTWIRTDTSGCVEAIFPALLRERANFVVKILQQAPDLREITIHWHDSAQDADSADLRDDIHERFLGFHATTKFKEYYIAENTEPDPNSVAGHQRAEFQTIVDSGLYRLY